MSFICKWFRRRRAKRASRPLPPLEETQLSVMSTEELLFCLHLNEYLASLGIQELEMNKYLLTFARFRIWFWDFMGYTHEDNLHINVLGDIEHYRSHGLFTSMNELANYGIMMDLESFINSEKHHNSLISGKWTSIGVSMKGKYCCIILGK